MTIGERIKTRRKELGISADDLAQQIGVDRTSMFRYEKGTIEKMPVSVLIPIADALHVDPVWLLTGHETGRETDYNIVCKQRPELKELLDLASESDERGVRRIIQMVKLMNE